MVGNAERKSILLVDDEPNQLLLYGSALKENGFVVDTASTGADAIKMTQETAYDCIVLDIRMRGMDGVEVLQKILERDVNTPIVLHTAFNSYRDNYLTWSADAYVTKSSDITELLRTVEDVLGDRLK